MAEVEARTPNGESRFCVLDFCYPLSNSFSFPLSDKNKSCLIERDFEYVMPPMASRIPCGEPERLASLARLPVMHDDAVAAQLPLS